MDGTYLIKMSIFKLYNRINEVHSAGGNTYIEYLTNRCILAPLNADTSAINRAMTNLMDSDKIVFTSVDRPDEENLNALPEESLNKLDFPGFPQHKLTLCLGMPVMLLRNLNVQQGLCNGTRIVLTRIGARSVEGTILTGRLKGNTVSIPKVLLRHSGEAQAKVSFYRYQFPLVPCYAMTINKSQGQTLTEVVLMLRSQVFAHGQLYVGLSRVRNPANLIVLQLSEDESIYNVINRNVLT
jgi:ATP-dependent DNA helicase PIF1